MGDDEEEDFLVRLLRRLPCRMLLRSTSSLPVAFLFFFFSFWLPFFGQLNARLLSLSPSLSLWVVDVLVFLLGFLLFFLLGFLFCWLFFLFFDGSSCSPTLSSLLSSSSSSISIGDGGSSSSGDAGIRNRSAVWTKNPARSSSL